jgi:hypothetical protein
MEWGDRAPVEEHGRLKWVVSRIRVQGGWREHWHAVAWARAVGGVMKYGRLLSFGCGIGNSSAAMSVPA